MITQFLSLALAITGFAESGFAQNYDWSSPFGGSLNDKGNSITVDNSGNIYTAGTFEGTVDFYPGSATVNYNAAGGTDGFIHKMNQPAAYHLTNLINGEKQPEVNAWPNPTSGKCTFRHSGIAGETGIRVYNSYGQLILSESGFRENTFSMDFTAFPEGIYIVEFRVNGMVSKLRIAKNN